MNKKIAVLATDGFEEVELTDPVKRLKEEGAQVDVVSLKRGMIKAWKHGDWSIKVGVDKTIDEAKADEYDGLLLPGGVINPDTLRTKEEALNFVRNFIQHGKPVAAICHGPQILINADVVEGRKMTSVSTISKDLINAGVNWVDKEVVVDNGLVTSRTPADLPAFIHKIIEEFSEGVHHEA